jgi:hypothetical protein
VRRGGRRRAVLLGVFAVGVLAVIIGFALLAPGDDGPDWVPAEPIAVAAAPQSVRLESGDAGEAVAVWLARVGRGVAPFASTRAPGFWFTPPQRLGAPGPLSDLQLVVNRSGIAVAAWRRRGRLEATRGQPGQPFEPPVPIADGVRPGIAAAIDANGRVELMWATAGRRSQVLLRNWLPGGLEPPRPALPASGPRAEVAALAATEQGTLAVVRRAGRIESVVLPLGEPAAAPQAISQPGASAPALAIDRRGDAVLAWRRAGAVEVAVRPAEDVFTAPAVLGAGNRPAVAIDEEGVAIVGFHGPRGALVSTIAGRDPHARPEPPELVLAGAATAVRVAADVQGSAQLLVERPGGGLVAVTRPWREAWEPPRTLARSGAVDARLAATPAGSAIVAWPGARSVVGVLRALPGRGRYSRLVTPTRL